MLSRPSSWPSNVAVVLCRDSICLEKVAMIRAYNQCSIYVRKWLCAQEQESTLAKRNRADVETRARAKLRGKNREKPVES